MLLNNQMTAQMTVEHTFISWLFFTSSVQNNNPGNNQVGASWYFNNNNAAKPYHLSHEPASWLNN